MSDIVMVDPNESRSAEPSLTMNGKPRTDPIQRKPIDRKVALAQAHEALEDFYTDRKSEAFKLIEHASNKKVTVADVINIQKAEDKLVKLRLDYLYASFFRLPAQKSTTPESIQELDANHIQNEIVRLLDLKYDPVPAKAAYTADFRRMVANAIHDATIAFYEKYVNKEDLAKFMAKRAEILKVTKSQEEKQNKSGRWTVKAIKGHTAAQSSRAAKSYREMKKKEEEEADRLCAAGNDGNGSGSDSI